MQSAKCKVQKMGSHLAVLHFALCTGFSDNPAALDFHPESRHTPPPSLPPSTIASAARGTYCHFRLSRRTSCQHSSLMILTGTEIKSQLGKNILIDPFDEKLLNPNSYNLRLHNELLVYEEIVLDMRRPNRYRRYVIPPEGFVLSRGTCIWAARSSGPKRTIWCRCWKAGHRSGGWDCSCM